MSINPSFFANTSGLGPQTGGFSPTPADSVSAAIRQQSSAGLMEHAARSSPSVRNMTGLLATGLAGSPSQAAAYINNTAQGQFLKDLAALAANTGLLPGGSPTQLAASVQQMVGTQGLVAGGNFGRGSAVFGGGQITDKISRSVFDSLKDNFYDQVTGLPKRAAHGMNMTQMGEAMGQLTARGAFRGMEVGELNLDDKGKLNFKIDKQKMERVNKVFSDYAGMLKDARKVFGDLPIAELTQNAERLVGTSLKEMGSVSAMRNRMANIQSTSAALGLNPAAVADRMMQMTDSVQAAMYQNAMNDPRIVRDPHLRAITSTAFGRSASDISNAAVTGGLQAGHYSAVAANQYAAQGVYMTSLGSEEAAQILAGTMQQMQTSREDETLGNVLAARHMLSVGKIKDPKAAAEIKKLIKQTTRAGSVKQTAELNQQISTKLAELGISVSDYKLGHTDVEMRNELDPLSRREEAIDSLENARRRLVEEGTISLNTSRDDYGILSETTQGIQNRENFSTFLLNVNKKAQDDLFASVGASGQIDEKTLNEAYEKNPTLARLLPKDKFKEMVTGFATDPNRKHGNLKDQMEYMSNAMRRTSRVQAAGSEMDRADAEERAVKTYLTTTSLGGGIDSESFGTELMRGFFGAGKIDTDTVLASLKNKGQLSNFKQVAGQGLDLNEESYEKLSSTIGKDQMAAIAAELNINPTNKQAMIEALRTSHGFAALQQNMGAAEMRVNEDGTVGFAAGDAIEKESKELESKAMMTAAKNLLGKDTKVGGDLTTPEGREKYNKDILGELTKNKGEKLSEFSKKFKKNDYSGEEFEAMSALYGKDDNIRKAILASAKSARAEGTEEGKQKYVDLMALNNQLASDQGGNKFLGVLELMSDSLAQLKLFQQSGG